MYCITTFKNPIGLLLVLIKVLKFIIHYLRLGFGFVEVGTITPKPQFGNPKPRVFRLEKDKGLINRIRV